MVAQFLGLKLRLVAGGFRRSPWQVFALVLGMIYGLCVGIVVVAGLIGARSIGDLTLVRTIVEVVGSCVVAGFLVLPVLFGIDDSLDPRRFALYGIPHRLLAGGTALASLVSVPVLVLAVCAFTTVYTWSRDPGASAMAVVSALLAIATCTLAARVTTSLASFLLATRRSRELSSLIGVLLVVAVTPLVVLLFNVDWATRGLSVLRSLGATLSWTPLGAVWAVPADAASGQWGAALAKLLIALAFGAVLWLAWDVLVHRLTSSPAREGRVKSYTGIGWFSRLPTRPPSAIAARAVTYWARDARYWINLVTIPVFPALMVLALLVAGVPGHYVALLPLPVMCLFLGWTVHNDVAYDSTALWLHLVSGTKGISDRLGRCFPALLIGVPLIAVGSVITVIVYGDIDMLVPIVGLSGAVLLIGLGLSSFCSALFPYPASKPGDSAFSQPQTSGASSALIQSFSFGAIVLLTLPIVACIVLGILISPHWLIGAPVLSIIIGFGTFFGGVAAGGRVFDVRGPELMAFALRND